MKTKPILACAGQQSEQIDSELLNELLLSYNPGLVGVRQKATTIATSLNFIASNDFEGDRLQAFKSIINSEFLYIQLMEAANLARQHSAEATCVAEDADLGAH
jgi:hypothetical protein